MTEQCNKPLVIGLAGFGTVGGGLARLLEENADLIRRRGGRDMVVKKVLVRHAGKARQVALPAGAELGRTLNALHRRVLLGELPNERGALLAAATKMKT